MTEQAHERVAPQNWGVLHRIQQDEREHLILRLRIRGVPDGITADQLRTVLERAGRVYAEGTYLWGNHRIVPQSEHPNIEHAAAETITFADLVDEAHGEKCVTIRMPIGLHAAIVRAARGGSVNQFCIDSLSSAVGYRDEPLPPIPDDDEDGGPANLNEFVRHVFLDIRHESAVD